MLNIIYINLRINQRAFTWFKYKNVYLLFNSFLYQLAVFVLSILNSQKNYRNDIIYI